MRRSFMGVLLGLVAFGGSPPAATAADAALTGAAAFPRIQSRVGISKAIDPSRFIHPVAEDVDTIDRSTSGGVTEFDERVTSYAEDPGGRTILLPEGQGGFDSSLPANGTIGMFSGTSTVSQRTTVTATPDTVSVHSSADIACSKTRIPNNALMGAFPTGSAVVTFNVQVARPCRYSFSASVAADADDRFFGRGSATCTVGGNDSEMLPDGSRTVGVEIQAGAANAQTRQSLSLSGVFHPGSVSVTLSAELKQSGPEGRASWNVTLRLSAIDPSDEIRWKSARNGSFATTLNWDPPTLPTDDGQSRNETAVFDRSGAYTVDFAAATKALGPAVTWERHRQRAGSVAFNHADLTLTATSLADPSLVVDSGGSLELSDTHLTSQHARMGDQRAGSAEVVLDGSDVAWDCLRTLVVGGGNGPDLAALVVAGGAHLASGGSAVGEGTQGGYVQVAGVGSTWTAADVDVGILGEGTVEVLNGAEWTSGNARVGTSPSVEGLVNLGQHGEGNPGSQWNAGDVTVGDGGPGELRIANGSLVNAEDVAIGEVNSGTCTVDGVSSTSEASLLTCGSLSLGSLATFDVRAGGVVAVARDMQVACSAHVSGSDASLARRSTLTVDGTLLLGATESPGFLHVDAGAQLTCGSAILGPGPSFFSVGVLEIGDASTPATAADCHVLGDLSIGQGGGRGDVLLRRPSTLRVGGTLTVTQNSSLEGVGTVTVGGPLQLDGTLGSAILVDAQPTKAASRAKLAPPTGGTLTIDGDLVVGPTGVVTAEAAGPQASRIVVTGDVTLGGTLVLQFRNGFAPRAGDPFEVLQADGAVVGDFATVEVRGLAPGAQFDVAKSGTTWVATAAADSVALPTVSVRSLPAKLLEKNPKRKGALTFVRKGDVATPLTVTYVVRGTAQNGVDCVQLLGSVTFPAKKRSVKVPVTVARDPFREGTETLEVSVVSGADYTTSLASTARFTIADFVPR